MNCLETKISGDLQRNCQVAPLQGIYDEVVVINRDDIDFSGTTISGKTITDLKLKIGTRGYKLAGVRELHNISFERSKGKFGYYYKHKYNGVLLDPNKEAREELDNLLNGKVVIVARRRYNGTAQFVVLGWELGLENTAHVFDANSNNGLETFEFATPEEDSVGESQSFLTLLETDVETTATAFENGFAS